jgi:hypothetical protein
LTAISLLFVTLFRFELRAKALRARIRVLERASIELGDTRQGGEHGAENASGTPQSIPAEPGVGVAGSAKPLPARSA